MSDMELDDVVIGLGNKTHDSPLGSSCPECGARPHHDCVSVDNRPCFPHAGRPEATVSGESPT